MPKEVVRRLMAAEPLAGMQNISASSASSLAGPGKPRGTYCVRCLVWRPPGRLADGYSSHHCGTFGRCIVKGNMPCFNALLAMLFASFGTLMVALYCSSPPERDANFRLL